MSALDPADPLYFAKARRLFLLSVLAEEFGVAVEQDPTFHTLIEHVEKAFEGDEQLRLALEQLFVRLQRGN